MITRNGKISISIDGSAIHIRSTQAKFINEVKEKLVSEIISIDKDNLTKNVITLRGLDSPTLRTKFLLETINNIKDYKLEEITQVGIFKNMELLDDIEDDDDKEERIANINDAHLKGNDVHRTSEVKVL